MLMYIPHENNENELFKVQTCPPRWSRASSAVQLDSSITEAQKKSDELNVTPWESSVLQGHILTSFPWVHHFSTSLLFWLKNKSFQ